MGDSMETRVFPSADEAADAAAQLIAEQIRSALAGGGRFRVAFSGGRTPARMLARLAEETLAWERVHIYQVDERIAPEGDQSRNIGAIRTAFDGVPAVLHPMPVDTDDPTRKAADYGRLLPGNLDLVQLGLGDDGHTASLTPGDPALDVTDRPVTLSREYRGQRRMTLTFSALNRARRVVWLVTGAEKRDAIAALLSGDPRIPASRVQVDASCLFMDSSAAPMSVG